MLKYSRFLQKKDWPLCSPKRHVFYLSMDLKCKYSLAFKDLDILNNQTLTNSSLRVWLHAHRHISNTFYLQGT